MQPPDSEPRGEDASGAFEHGQFERAPVESNSGVGAGGASEATMTSSNSNNDEVFFDAFVDADGPKSLGGGAALGGPAAQTATPSTEPGWTEVDLFSDFAAAANGEAANGHTPMHEKESNDSTNQSHGGEADPFGAFNSVDPDQTHLRADNAILPQVYAPEDDIFSGAFGSAGEAGSPPVADQSGVRDGPDANEGTNTRSPEKDDEPTTEKSDAEKKEMKGTPTSDGFGDFDGDPQTNDGGDSGFAPTGGDSPLHDNSEGGSSSQKDTPYILPIQTNEHFQETTGTVRGDNAGKSESGNKTFLGDLLAVSLSADRDQPETEPQPQIGGTAPQVSKVNNISTSEGGDAIVNAPETNLENKDSVGSKFGGFAAFGGTAPYTTDVGDGLSIASLEQAPPPAAALVNDGDFGGFASLGECPSNPPAGEGAMDSQSASNELDYVSAIENGVKDNVALSDGVAVTVIDTNAVDIVAGNNYGAGKFKPEGIPPATGLQDEEVDQDGTLANAPYAEEEDDADFGGLVSVEEVPAIRPSSVESLARGDDFGNCEALSEEAPGLASPDATAEAEVPASRPAAIADFAAGDGFSSFDAFEGAPGGPSLDHEPAQNDGQTPDPAEEETPTSHALSVEEPTNEAGRGFGNSCCFNAFEETPEKALPDGESTENDENMPAPVEDGTLESQLLEGARSAKYNADGADDEFRGFGGFSAFEGTPEETSPDDVHIEDDKNMLTASEGEGLESLPSATERAANDADDHFGDFGDFDASEDGLAAAAPDATLTLNDHKALPPAEEEMQTVQPGAFASSGNDADDEFGDFGDFDAVKQATAEASPDVALIESEEKAPEPAEKVAPASHPSAAVSSVNDADDEFGDFGDFEAFEDALPGDAAPSESDHYEPNPAEDEVPTNQPSAVAVSADKDDDEFSDFAAPDATLTLNDHKALPPAEEETQTVQPGAFASSGNDADDEFGDFGDFDAVKQATAEASPDVALIESEEKAPELAEKVAPASHPSAAVSSVNDADDEFGDFGDFDAFEDALPGDAEPSESDHCEPNPAEEEAPTNQPSAVAVSADKDDDEFSDFGDFEEFEESPNKEPLLDASPPTENDEKSVPKSAEPPALSILNERINSMFHDVFVTHPPIASDFLGKGTCSELPIDLPVRKVLLTEVAPKEKGRTQTAQSQCKLDSIKKYFQGLPCSPPLTILSEEKWYPYSQYEFQRDGSPRAGAMERSTTPSVPEVLSVDLPTEFDTTNLAPRSSTHALTVVNFPSTPENNQSTVVALSPKLQSEEREVNNASTQQGSAASDQLYCSQLSEIGEKFMEQLPDLSYMLTSTLSLPNDKK